MSFTSERCIKDRHLVRVVDFPEDPTVRFNTVFPAVGNSESKCVAQLVLKSYPLSANDLYRDFVFVTSGVWKSDSNLVKSYYQKSLVAVGLTAEESILFHGSSEYVTGFRASQGGIIYGQPVAAFLIYQSRDRDYSLGEVFRQTSTGPGQTRSVLNRVGILEALAAGGKSFQHKNIQDGVDIGGAGIGEHLEDLRRMGFVKYRAVNTEKEGFALYTVAENADKSSIKRVNTTSTQLTQDVLDVLFQLGIVNRVILAERLKGKYPGTTEEVLKRNIGQVLSGLSQARVCEPVDITAKTVHALAEITPAGRKIVSELISPIRSALADGSYLDEWRTLPWQQHAPYAVARYRERSGNANQRPIEDTANRVLQLIEDTPGLRPSELKTMINRRVTERALKYLLQRQLTRKEHDGKAVKYYPTRDN